ncbi:MAG: hypothetical protein JO148_05610 [Acidimicrobiia bacterium]|nr:hypothetical protein [Acidimicrobiia bacterium]
MLDMAAAAVWRRGLFLSLVGVGEYRRRLRFGVFVIAGQLGLFDLQLGGPARYSLVLVFGHTATVVPSYARRIMQAAGDLSAATGPVKAAQDWIAAVQLGRYDRAWAMTDPRLRLVRAQAWIWNNRKDADIAALNRDEVARALAEERPNHGLWGDFAATEVHQMREVYGTFQPANWGATSNPGSVGPDYAMVLFAHLSGDPLIITDRPPVFSLAFLMHSTDRGWMLASFSDVLPTPGWPPKLE